MASLAFETQIMEHDMNMLYVLYLKQFFYLELQNVKRWC